MKSLTLPNDLVNICVSYLDKYNTIYIRENLKLFQKSSVCIIASQNGWLDLLKWASVYYGEIHGKKHINSFAINNNHLNIIKWMH